MSNSDRLSLPDIFLIFLKLGLTSFGGPVAHIGIFRTVFVEQKAWLSDRDYSDLVALAQFLPGPASSQVGMGLGLMRGGIPGLIAAWLGFTLPSALLMAGFAIGLDHAGFLEGASWISGVKAAVVAIVAQALWGMAKGLTPDAPRASIALCAAAIALLLPGAWSQAGAILLAGLAGMLLPVLPAGAVDQKAGGLKISVSHRVSVGCLIAFFVLLIGLPLLSQAIPDGTIALIDAFYRSGALVFGGGHVVLPLLQGELVEPGLIDKDAFLAGYGGAQVMPGPLFTIAAHLGALAEIGPGGIGGAVIALVAIFLSSALLIIGALPYWARMSESPLARRGMAAVGASVVGLLAAALYDPVFLQGITAAPDLILAATCLIALTYWKIPVWVVVPAAGLIGALLL